MLISNPAVSSQISSAKYSFQPSRQSFHADGRFRRELESREDRTMTKLKRQCLTFFACLVVAASWSELPEAHASNITAIQVSPDARQIMIKGDGPLGKHSAFVINQPYRLVVDFDLAGLGPLPRRTKINGSPINEVRLGTVNSRSRVVADFGETPVPPFKIHLRGNLVVIAMDDWPSSTARFGTATRPSRSAGRISDKPSPRLLSAKASPKAEERTGLVIKTSGTKDSLVYMELVDRTDPKRVYRLAIDCDLAGRRIRHATLSDKSGAVRRFELAAADPHQDSQQGKSKPIVGPRRQGTGQAVTTTKRPKYQWGLPNVEKNGPQDQQLSSKSPFQSDDSAALARVSSR